MAVDTSQNAFTFDGSHWSGAANDLLSGAQSVSCPLTTFCTAGGFNGSVSMLNSGTWGPSTRIDPGFFYDSLQVSCTSSTFCVAGDTNGNVLEYSGPSSTSTTTTLAASPPGGSVTNQTVTLTAHVSATSGTPTGTVAFSSSHGPISGCTAVQLLSGTATCQTAFTASSPPGTLAAAYMPAGGSGFTSSTGTLQYTTTKDATATTLSVSNTAPQTGQSVAYTATVTPAHAGPAAPTGAVEFKDGSTPIGGCTAQALSGSAATCTVTYAAKGTHSISAQYLGDGNFAGSSSPAQTVTVSAPPPPPTSQTLTVSVAGTGSGTVTSSPAGISCSAGSCSAPFATGTSVSLSAAPATGSTFAGWSGACSGTGACSVTMSSDQAVTATFTKTPPPPPPPTCTVKAKSSRVPLKTSKKHGKKGTLKFGVHCDQAANVKLTGKVKATSGKKHKTFKLSTARGSVAAGASDTFTLKLSGAALRALAAGAKESVSVTLNASDANGTSTASARIGRLHKV